MKKSLATLVLLILSVVAFAQSQTKPQWTSILSDQPETFRTQLVSSSEGSIKVNVQVPGFYMTNVTTPRGEAKVVTMPKAVSTAKAGEPDMPMTGLPLMIGDKARMNVRIIDAQYMDFDNFEVAPSKGDFPRSIDPATVPYTYGECYSQDAFFPASNIDLYEPYIIRDFRGQNMAVYPFAYNPVSKTLRVYYNMTVEMYKVDDKGTNVIETRRSNEVKMSADFKSVYQRHFLNYESGMKSYTPLDEEGDLLIICHDSFISSMTDFVNWKKTRGINTTIVGTTTAGSTYSAIKAYIQNQYDANNNLTHVLLVGDVAQIPGYSYSGGGSDYSGLGDNAYGQIVGSDIYNDVIIGRFSASSAARVTTQCQRAITYERDLTTSASWLQKGEGISRKENGSGHNSEDDYQHMDNIRTDLLNYGYTSVTQRYANLTGYDGSSSTISSDLNSGVGIVNYANHGQETAWGANSSGYIYYANSHVNALTNDNKLPFIFSVACLVGKYDHSSDCFAEAWMNATNSSTGEPTGAIGTLMSYISQPWIPPMWAQDECIDILVESYTNNKKYSFGGISINGLMGIFDHYSTSEQQAVGTYQAWIVYGDPTLMVRTKTPQAMTVNHTGSITLGSSSYAVNVSNGNGSVATITDADHNILGKATVSNGTATVNLNSSDLTPGSQLTLCVFGYNKVTYLGTIDVVGGTQYNIALTQPQHGTISAPSQAYANSIVTLTATPETGYCLSSWTVKTTSNQTITVTNNQFTMPESDVTVTATFVQGMAVTLASVTNGTISADPLYALQGNAVNLTATPATGYEFNSWVVYKTGDVSTTVTVSGNSFTMPNYPVTVSAVFLAPAGGDVTIGSDYGTTNGGYLPTHVWYKYSLTQQIYTAAELGSAGTITAISFYYNGSTSSGARTIEVYLAHTTSATISSWITQSSSNLVYSGSHEFTQGWNTITLSTPFAYNGTNNVILTFDDNTGNYSVSSTQSFYTYSTGTTRAIRYYSDSSNLSATSSNSTSGTTLQNNNYIKFTKEVPSTDGYLSVSPTSLTGFEATAASAASASQNVAVVGANLQSDVTVTLPNGYEVSSNGSTYASTLTLTPTNGELRQNLYVRLAASLNTGNYTGDMTITSGTTTATVSLNGVVNPGSGTQYTITATANPTAGGTVSGAGTYYENSTCTLTATANTGYTFTSWSDGNTQNPRTFNVSGNASYTANFTLNSYEVTATANPAAGGTISGTGSYDHGTTASLTATANEGYTFTNWTKNGVSVSTNATYSFTVTEATALVANFTINSYNVTATANPTEGGTVTVGSSKGDREDLVYDFEDGWQGWTTFQGTTTSPHSWMHNTEYTAYDSNGSQIVPECHNSSTGMMLSESYISASTSGGSDATAVTPDNYLVSPQFRLGGSFKFYAASRMSNYPAEKFSVLVSETGNSSASAFTHTELTVTLSDNSWNEYTIDLSDYSGMGYVAIRHYDCNDQHLLYIDDVTIVEGVLQTTGSGNFNYGETCVVTATPNEGYHFVNWTENGTAVSSDASYTFTVANDRDLVANFSETLPTYYTISVTANPTDGGTVTGADSYVEGSNATLTATANEGYTFTNWTKNGNVVSTNANYSFTVTEAGTYVANFTLNTYTITALVNPENAGTVTGAGTYSHGATVTLTATANEGYSFVNWTENGNVYCTNATCVSTAAGDRTLVANFEEVVTTITQTSSLTSGCNWWTANMDITLEQLETALGANGITITAQDGSSVSYHSVYGWGGDNFTIEVGKMYKIQTASNCNFTIEGPVADPADHSITLNPGNNWIGFFCTQAMSLNAAFVNLNATEDDVITAQDGSSASYHPVYGWGGDLTTLEPGQAYTYTSKATSNKTFTFPSSK